MLLPLAKGFERTIRLFAIDLPGVRFRMARINLFLALIERRLRLNAIRFARNANGLVLVVVVRLAGRVIATGRTD